MGEEYVVPVLVFDTLDKDCNTQNGISQWFEGIMHRLCVQLLSRVIYVEVKLCMDIR